MTPRCFVPPETWLHDTITLTGDDSHHLVDVLRMEIGASVMICDGQGGEATAVITAYNAGILTVWIVDRKRQADSGVTLTLIQAVPKSQKMDLIIQKATEMGICAIRPVMTDRGVVRLENERADHRTIRWQRIASEAAKQCRTLWIPKVYPVETLSSLLETKLALDALLIGSLEPASQPLKICLRELRERHIGSVGLLIGPEGDFSQREYELARKAGAIPISYGSRVLRVETAALYGVSVLAYELMDDHV